MLPVLAALAISAAPLEFHLTFDAKARPAPFTGRVYVLLHPSESDTLRAWPNWFSPTPGFASDVVNWRPGEKLVLDKSALGYPVSLDRVKKGAWTVQAVMDTHPDHRHFTTAPGNVWTTRRVELDPATTGPVALHLDRVYEERPFKESENVKLVEVESKLLTAFHKRPTRLRAAVVLPDGYAADTNRRYPALYEIPGFGGTHTAAHMRAATGIPTKRDGVELLYVLLDPSCHHGHHVFADSANNGPVGRALVEELIPAVEAKFRAIPKPEARLLTGHSSGGWSSLWLQVTYPDFFGGCWSTAPDPVDFRDFQRINIYRPGENMFTDRDGQRRPLARRGGKPVLWYKDFSDMEEVMGHGGQLASFEAVFSERGPDGKPRRLWDRKTGAIDPEVAKSWEKYDIRLVMERDWDRLGPKLAGKVHVYMGDQDTFYLEGATRLLKESQAKLKGGAVVELFAGKDHSTLMSGDLRARIAREMAARLRAARVVD
jgi:S-formylglutathione hydrolase FrmB